MLEWNRIKCGFHFTCRVNYLAIFNLGNAMRKLIYTRNKRILVYRACAVVAVWLLVAWCTNLFGGTQAGIFPYSQRTSFDEGLAKIAASRLKGENLSMDFLWLSHPQLPRMLSQDEYMDYLDLLETFASLMESANITYAMHFGTLLGSYRMHNMIPWDDDIDLIVKFDDMMKIIELIQRYSKLGTHRAVSDYLKNQKPKLYHNMDFLDLDLKDLSPDNMFYSFKFFPISGIIQDYGWRYPYLDVFIFKENETDICVRYGKHSFYLKRQLFYPLARRPFGRLWLPCPRDSNHSLHALYGDFEKVCATGPFNHRNSTRFGKGGKIKCEELREHYPYVIRRQYPSYAKESLMFKDERLHSVTTR